MTTMQFQSPRPNKFVKLYDESIFSNGETFLTEVLVGFTNKADQYLLQTKLNKKTTSNCQSVKVMINPSIPCSHLNIYTMYPSLQISHIKLPFNTVKVLSDKFKTTIVQLEEYDWKGTAVYDLNIELTRQESAIMIKYYAINFQGVKITNKLYMMIKDFFDPKEKWFDYSFLGVYQNNVGELINYDDKLDNNNMQYERLVNTPLLTISNNTVLTL